MHALNWFEIPALDLSRAFAFYSAVLPAKVRMGTFGQGDLILFDIPFSTGEAVGGSVVCRPDFLPSNQGSLIYLNAFGPLADAVKRIAPAGGQVLVPEINLGKFGYAAIFMDSEGNRLGLISHEA
ncbi:MAG: VOC family protein [Bacteroidetes bacterium]|nr:VOC family protein [Bacteroidota bacterium]